MSEFKPDFDMSYRYFAHRLPLERLAKTAQVNVHCPFHQDKNPSLSINLEKAVWHCHSCNQSGGILDFEKAMFAKNTEDAWAEIYRVCGMEPPKQNQRLVATYDYVDEAGKTLFQKLRFEPKHFIQRQPDGKGGWWNNTHGVRKVLYRLPDVIVARTLWVVEGEKDADNLREALQAAGVKECAVTTCCDGAGTWIPQYSVVFASKLTVVLGDNDAKGKAHTQTVAASIKPYAAKLKVVELPGLPEKGDVSDWLAQGHTVTELMALVKAAPLWEAETSDHVLLEEMRDFLDRAPAEIDWLVEGLIPVRTRGLMVADGKVGKSPLALDLALALASGSSWLGHAAPQRRRVAVISREDAPQETARRLRLLAEGSAARGEYNWGQIWMNTMDQSPEYRLDNLEQVDALIKELQMEQFDLAIFDVLRELHGGDENDNTVMAGVLAALKRVQVEARCGILLLHHLSKAQSTNVFRDARGAGAIHGWTEWGAGMTVVDELAPRKDWVRKVDFELKYACPADTVYFKIVGDETALRIELTEPPEKAAAKPRRKVQEIVSGIGDQGSGASNPPHWTEREA